MSTQYSQLPGARLEPAEKVLRAAIHLWNHPDSPFNAQHGRVFVTVSRQPGAGAIWFSHRLAERLKRDGQDNWSAWDHELVEKVSAEHGIDKEIIEMIPNQRHGWLEEMVQGFFVSRRPPDVAEISAYKRMAMTIRALATAGHAIIVGQGGTFITEGMPGAIHLRLVAPLEHRIKHTADREKLSLHEAAARIVDVDHRRTEFYRRYWPGKVNAPEAFTMTLNAGELSVDELVECVVPLVRRREAGEENWGKEETTKPVREG